MIFKYVNAFPKAFRLIALINSNSTEGHGSYLSLWTEWIYWCSIVTQSMYKYSALDIPSWWSRFNGLSIRILAGTVLVIRSSISCK